MNDRFDRLNRIHMILASCTEHDIGIEETVQTIFEYWGLTTISYLRHQEQIPTSIGITTMHHRINSDILGIRAVKASDLPNLAGATSAKAITQALKVNKTNAANVLANINQVETAQRRNRILKMKKCIHAAFEKTFEKVEINHFLQFQNSANAFISIKSTKQFAKLMQELLIPVNDKDVPLLSSNFNPFLLRENTRTGEFTFELRNEHEKYLPTIAAIEPLKDADVLKNYFILKSHDARHHQAQHASTIARGSLDRRKDISSLKQCFRIFAEPVVLS
jgi:hypothetical protein